MYSKLIRLFVLFFIIFATPNTLHAQQAQTERSTDTANSEQILKSSLAVRIKMLSLSSENGPRLKKTFDGQTSFSLPEDISYDSEWLYLGPYKMLIPSAKCLTTRFQTWSGSSMSHMTKMEFAGKYELMITLHTAQCDSDAFKEAVIKEIEQSELPQSRKKQLLEFARSQAIPQTDYELYTMLQSRDFSSIDAENDSLENLLLNYSLAVFKTSYMGARPNSKLYKIETPHLKGAYGFLTGLKALSGGQLWDDQHRLKINLRALEDANDSVRTAVKKDWPIIRNLLASIQTHDSDHPAADMVQQAKKYLKSEPWLAAILLHSAQHYGFNKDDNSFSDDFPRKLWRSTVIETTTQLINSLKDDAAKFHAAAALASLNGRIRDIAAESIDNIQPLATVAAHPDPDVSAMALEAIANLKIAAPALSVELLNNLENHQNVKVRAASAKARAGLSVDNQLRTKITDALCASVKDENPQVREIAIMSLLEFGTVNEKVRQTLEAAKRDDPNKDVRIAASNALLNIDIKNDSDPDKKKIFEKMLKAIRSTE
ncbi:putative oxidoreductase/HEAT repeat-containing protein [Anaerohalosphaera lusitana]|uniref:Putative oxidoreductase/HEAT repeat-containing protein n=1 Tax=Anaerohalosphaera lusitana TaxID=1936003 RepID=A0A1U9NHT3_9BACT|nr:HEAT repeat domain-containing protein [Anaerohalosphaera lusitana]AQT67483.1 putative oxidoreductase/HEAT repeat-containing protein [Anaerohalosphaera lusitana]